MGDSLVGKEEDGGGRRGMEGEWGGGVKGGVEAAAAVADGVVCWAEPRGPLRHRAAAAAAPATAATGVRGSRMEEAACKKCVAVVAADGLRSSMDLARAA